MDPDCVLPQTGSDASPMWLMLGAAALVLGVIVLVAARRGRGGGVATLLLVAVAGASLAMLWTGAPPAAADETRGCPTSTPPMTPSPSPSVATPSVTPSSSPSPSASTTPTSSGTPTVTATPTATQTATPTPTPTPTEACRATDKGTGDTDGDGVIDDCDLDSDNDGIPDAIEDLNRNGRFRDDDVDGDILLIALLGDGVSSFLDLDTDNDTVLDLFEAGIPKAVIEQIDRDRNGVIDADVPVGANGLADIVETTPDSGVINYTIRNSDDDDKSDFFDLNSNGSTFDMYEVGSADRDLLGGGFLQPSADPDADGIMDPVDTALAVRGAPGSPPSPYEQ